MEDEAPSARATRSTPKPLAEGATSNLSPRTRSMNNSLTPSLGYGSTPRSRTRVTRDTPLVSVLSESRVLRHQSMGTGDSPQPSAGVKYRTPKLPKRGKAETPKSATLLVSTNQERDALVGTLCQDIASTGSIPSASCLTGVMSTGPAGFSELGDSVTPCPSEVVVSVPPGHSAVDASVPPGHSAIDASVPPGHSAVDASVPPGPSEVDASVPPGPSEVDASVPPGRSEVDASVPPGCSEVGASVPPGCSEVDSSVPPGRSEVGASVPPGRSEVGASVPPGPSEVHASVPPGPSEVHASVPPGPSEVHASVPPDPNEVDASSVPPGPSEVLASLPAGSSEVGVSLLSECSEVAASSRPDSSEVCASLPPCPSEEGASVPPCPTEVGASVHPCPSGLCTLMAPCLVEAGVSVTSFPGEMGTSEAHCLVDVCVPGRSFQGEACASLSTCPREVGASVASCPREDGTSRAPVAAEGCDLLVSANEGTLEAEGETAHSAAAAVHDAGVLPGTSANPVIGKVVASETPVPKEGAASQADGCTTVEQNSSKISFTRDHPSVDIFNTTVETFLEKLVEAGSYQRFAKCYERFYKFQPEMTRSIYDQFISQLQTSFKDEIREMKEEGNLEALLHSLDKIKDEAKSRVQPAWRPSGIPEEDLQSTLVPYYLQQKEYMRRLLKEKESENAKLAESVLAGRTRIAALQEQIQKRKEAWKAVSQAQRKLVMSLQEPKSEKLRWDP